jgi:uncharacterized membrane protein YphA (DoxX/SURF4 family)
MNIALWIVQVLVACVFLMAGSTKVMRSKEQLAKMMGWVQDFAPGTIRLIGTVEILGALGLILPALTKILPWLTWLAAVGLVLTMIGAIITHLRRAEYPNIAMPIVLLVLSAFIAYGRFVIAPF